MPDNKKEQEREELHRAIWAIADDLRGSVDGWDFKSYVLGIMFYRYISENLTNYINADEIAAGNADFDYAKLSDEEAEQAREDLVQTKGFFILPSELFVNVRARAPQDDRSAAAHANDPAALQCAQANILASKPHAVRSQRPLRPQPRPQRSGGSLQDHRAVPRPGHGLRRRAQRAVPG